MKRKRTSDCGQWWNIVETRHGKGNSKMIWCWWREKEHRTVVNVEILLKFFIVREILKWSNFMTRKKPRTLVNDEILFKFLMVREILKRADLDENKTNIRRCPMMKHSWNPAWWRKFWRDLIYMNSKKTSNVGQRLNIAEIPHDEKASTTIWFWWREKEHRT